jgi:hypothetical protein
MAGRRRRALSVARRPRIAIAALAAFALFVCNYGLGASHGSGATVLAAGNQVIASCGSGMTFVYTTAFNVTDSSYAVSGIELSHIPGRCHNQSLSATFSDGNGAPLGPAVDATLTSAGTTQTIAIALKSTNIDASKVHGISVVVS